MGYKTGIKEGCYDGGGIFLTVLIVKASQKRASTPGTSVACHIYVENSFSNNSSAPTVCRGGYLLEYFSLNRLLFHSAP
ncbi:hypothetical protein Tco_0084496 [Tanacetum coccineum]